MQRYSTILVIGLLACASGPAWAQNLTAFSPDGKRFITANGQTIGVFDAQTQKELINIRGHTDDVTSVAFSPDGRLLASGGKDKTACLWEAATGKEIRRMRVPNSVANVAFSGDGKNLIVRENDQTLREFEIASGKEIRVGKEKEKK